MCPKRPLAMDYLFLIAASVFCNIYYLYVPLKEAIHCKFIKKKQYTLVTLVFCCDKDYSTNLSCFTVAVLCHMLLTICLKDIKRIITNHTGDK